MARGFGATLGVSTSDVISSASFVSPVSGSFACWYNRNGAGGLGNARIFDKQAGSPGEIILRNNNSSGTITMSQNFTTTSGQWETSDAEAIATGKWVHIVAVWDGVAGNVPVFYINGRVATMTTTIVSVGTPTQTNGPLSIGNRTTSGVGWDGLIDDAAFWSNKRLSAAEARALFQGADPRTIWPQYLTEYLIFGDGKPYSAIKATQPTVTGTKVRAGRLVVNTGRTFPFAQLPASNQTVAPSKGAIVINGKTPTVKLDQFIAPSKGSIVLSGKTPTVTVNTIISPSKGAVVITGKVPTVAVTANQVVAPSKGSVVIGGKTPTVDTNQTVSPAKGAVVIGGKTPTVTINALIAPSKGSVVIGGYAPTVGISQFIAPAKGALRITGYAPVVVQPTSQVINPAKGALRLTGYVPTVTASGQGGDTHDGATLKRHAELRKKRQKQVDALLQTKIAEADEIAATIREQLAPKAPISAISKSATKVAKVAPAAALFPIHDYEQEDEEIMALLFA